MTKDDKQLLPLSAEVVQLDNAAGSIDSLNIRIAMQIAPRRWAAGLQQLVAAVDQGQSLEVAISRNSTKMPAELRAILQAGLRLPEPTRFLLDAIVADRESQAVRRQLMASIFYPLLMLLFGAGVCFTVTNTLHVLMVDGFSDFGLVGFDSALAYVADQRMALLAILCILIWCLAVGVTLRLFGPKWAGMAVLGGLPLYGRPLRWASLHGLVNRLALTSKQTVDPMTAVEAMEASFRGSSREVVANLALRRIKAGTTTGAALSQSMLSDGLCAPLLLSIDHHSKLADGCEQVAQALGKIAEIRCRFLSMTMPILVVITIATMAWGTISGYVAIMTVLVSLISSLA